MASARTQDQPLEVALDRLIDEAAGFDRRQPRDIKINLKLTASEHQLLTRLAADKGISRIALIRRLLARGFVQDYRTTRLADAATRILKQIRARNLVTRMGKGEVDDLRIALELLEASEPRHQTRKADR